MALVGRLVLGGQDDGVAGQSMTERVERGALFAGIGTGASGFLDVGTIDGGTIGGAVVAVGMGDV